MLKHFIMILSLFGFLSGCYSLKETERQSGNTNREVYIFDDVTKIDTVIRTETDSIKIEQPIENDTANVLIPKTMYSVQVGAFSTYERAVKFINDAQKLSPHKLEPIYKEESKLWIVKLPSFTNRDEAEAEKNKIKVNPIFKDAFIIIEYTK